MNRRWTIRLEFKPVDCWVGVFWRRSFPEWYVHLDGPRTAALDVWVCLVPMLPIHIRHESTAR